MREIAEITYDNRRENLEYIKRSLQDKVDIYRNVESQLQSLVATLRTEVATYIKNRKFHLSGYSQR